MDSSQMSGKLVCKVPASLTAGLLKHHWAVSTVASTIFQFLLSQFSADSFSERAVLVPSEADI